MNQIDQLLQAIVNYDAQNKPYSMKIERLSDNIIKFTSDNRKLMLDFQKNVVQVMIYEGITGNVVTLERKPVGPSLIQQCFAYLLWVMGN